jgi:hypothetical protein
MVSLKEEIDVLREKEGALISRLEETTGKKVHYHTKPKPKAKK